MAHTQAIFVLLAAVPLRRLESCQGTPGRKQRRKKERIPENWTEAPSVGSVFGSWALVRRQRWRIYIPNTEGLLHILSLCMGLVSRVEWFEKVSLTTPILNLHDSGIGNNQYTIRRWREGATKGLVRCSRNPKIWRQHGLLNVLTIVSSLHRAQK